MTWKIQAITGDLTGQEISIDRDMLVGRHQAADIVLQAAEISRKHAAFLLKENALWVQDLGSSNGTFVNDMRIDSEALLKQGDIVQFASLKFSVLEPAQEVIVEPELEQTAERIIEEAAEKTAAHQMNDQGIPELKERDAEVQLTRDGMPTNVGIPKPAPIPEGIDLSAVKPEPTPIPVEQPISRVEEAKEQQKNASVGLISLIVIVILAIMAWLFFK
ncbi:FHA domain-containing protein [Acinetobacter schindleri]|uniref:FHA domain-containing protein n=2 Tax=Acinetobacter TaxID=469 RepID=A0AAE6WYF9_9GAMM|nr:FHA domain-containing protein [Acinetobacter schindleri]MCO8067678.1 FHA domain-containing protein [Acinetobacter schindleri]QIC68376.1 FHA domain-containing protein [Acinetobacter schindleri]UOH74791.1 FHA domain-containing protein [Acinetobacter schindleri]WDE15798.1 FHA domain-containing protein [Acinetobacter schindleri]